MDRYLSDPIEKKSRHSAIADYFLGRNFVGERKLRYFLLISYPDLLSTKPKARSGQGRKIIFSDWLNCEGVTCARYGVCNSSLFAKSSDGFVKKLYIFSLNK